MTEISKHLASLSEPLSHYIYDKVVHLEPAAKRQNANRLPMRKDNDTVNEKLKRIAFAFPEEFTSLTRIPTLVPPHNIHRMQRADDLWFGDLYSANLVIRSLFSSGVSLKDARILDFGCSSGSLCRVLVSHPGCRSIYGCDPIKSAIEWASIHLPGRYVSMSNMPPLPFGDQYFDLITAVSIWSHYRPDAGEVWLEEMVRVLKPNGVIFLTYCSEHHLEWSKKTKRRSDIVHTEIEMTIKRSGNYFRAINYDAEDNLTDDRWGHSVWSSNDFKKMCKKYFSIIGEFRGANQGNQDVLILKKA